MRLNTFARICMLAMAVAIFTALSLIPSPQVSADGNGTGNVTVLVLNLNDGDVGSDITTITATWTDSQECSAGYNVYLDGVESSSVGLPEGATVDDSGRIHLASVASSTTQVTASFAALFAASGASSLTVSVYCGNDDGSGRAVAAVDAIGVDAETRRPIQGAYSSAPTVRGIQGSAISDTNGGSGFVVTDRKGNIFQRPGHDVPDYTSPGPGQSNGDGNSFFDAKGIRNFVPLSNGGETHSYIETTIADSGARGSKFTITWVDAWTCDGNYNLYMDNIDSNGVGLPSGATQDSDGRVHLGAVAATTDPLQTIATFSAVKAVSDSDHLALLIYCDDDTTGRKIESDVFPVVSTTLRPVAGTYSSAPGITEFQIDGTAQSDFDPYKTYELFTYDWNAGEANEATIKPVLKDGYSATYHGSTKTVYVITANGIEIGKFATWAINYDLPISDADADPENGFQFRFDDNNPDGTDMFLLSVSRGDYHTGHHYIFFVIRKAAVAGSTMLDYAENGTDAIGTYSISDPDRDYSWRLASRTGEGEEDDKDAFAITKNDDGNGVLSFASSPDYEAPTDSSSPADNVYHTAVLGWEVNPVLGLWYGNYYGYSDVQVTVTNVAE